MMRQTRAIFFAGGLAAGAITMLIGLSLLVHVNRCTGLSIFGLSHLDQWNCSDVGRFQRIQGVWVDGLEEARFFPSRSSLPQPAPTTDAALVIDEATKVFIYDTLPKTKLNAARNIIVIDFMGNELRPRYSAVYQRNFVVRRVLSTRLIRSESD